jgi:flagellar biosynthesis protein FlhG
MTTEALASVPKTEPTAKNTKVIAITSGKGGVGKTNISANLAISMAASGKKVLLVDADFSLSNLDIVMNLRNRYNVSHLLNGQKSLDEIIHTSEEGVEVICGMNGLEELANISEFQKQRLMKELSSAGKINDAIIIDTAAGISKSVVGFCLAADHVLVVTTPEATAMTDAYSTIKVLVGHKYDGRISLIVNMADSILEGRRIYQQIAGVARRFLNTHIYDAGTLLYDEKLKTAVRQRTPVVNLFPNARITASIKALSARLNNGMAAQINNDGFFQKVVKWFL